MKSIYDSCCSYQALTHIINIFREAEERSLPMSADTAILNMPASKNVVELPSETDQDGPTVTVFSCICYSLASCCEHGD